ncbi:MAG: PEP-CTERM sorting domain-containing protein [Acidobacteriota bacterium]
MAHANTIQYVPNVNQTYSSSGGDASYTLTLGSSGSFLQLAANGNNSEDTGVITAGGAFMGASGTIYDLAAGDAISSSLSGTQTGKLVQNAKLNSGGDFSNSGGSGYLGFYYTDTDGIHTGWMNVSTSASNNGSSGGGNASFTVNDYALDSMAGEGILAGQTDNSPVSVTPEPSTLSLLALGASGLAVVRRRRANA